jgi:hypothetical protein
MVSGFLIKTNIRVSDGVDPRLRKDFQLWAENYECRSAKAPAYFDQGFYEIPENFEVSGETEVIMIGWDIDFNGFLIVECDKFHSAITTLHYCITEFFAPRNIKLNGTILGVNTDYAMLYVYTVQDNVFTLDIPNTAKFLKEYKDDDFECDDMLKIMQIKMKM